MRSLGMIHYGGVANVPVIEPFEEYCSEYDQWFDDNRFIYLSELAALRHFIRAGEWGVRIGMEIGVGTGRFAAPLGIGVGVDPSPKMGEVASERGISVVSGVAESLPFRGEEFDFVLMMATICFVDDVERSLHEVNRILKKEGVFILAFVDKESPVGKVYQAMKEKSLFYRPATFFSTEELLEALHKTGFREERIVQTVFGMLDEVKEVQPVREGYGEGSFVVIRAGKV